MRGDVTLTARLLLRGTGLAGLVAALGGGVAVAASTRPWYVTVARVEMLGESQSRPVESVAGLPAVPWAWAVFVAGLLALAIGLSVAIDRPYPRSRMALAFLSAALGVGAGLGLVGPPEAELIVGPDTRELLDVAEQLPVGVELTVTTGAGRGAGLALVAAALVAAGAAAARDL